jgi:hypothetical protein
MFPRGWLRTGNLIGNALPSAALVAALLCATGLFGGQPQEGEHDALVELPIDPYDRQHWAFRPLVAPAVPAVRDHAWPRTSIDHFILAELEARSLAPAPAADRQTLIRRLTLNLTGLPPTPEELATFLNDGRADAYRRLVDRLLASPQYGQRWGQYWLDLARFAETDGFEHDHVRPQAWAYRDWVIEALCDDLPYDEFISLQLAADILRPGDPGALVATGFCLSGPDMPDLNSQQERKHVLLNEVTSTVGAVLFSLQMGCAQCHDHKYDAISQGDFFRLRAFFDPAVKLTANKSLTTLDRGADPAAISQVWLRGDWQRPGPPVSAAFPRIANPQGKSVESNDPGERRRDLARWLTDPAHPLTARSIVNRVWQHHFGRGLSATPSDFGVMGEEPTHPELLDHLAWRLIARGWSLKDLHRQIVLSAVYRTASRAGSGSDDSWTARIDTDPANRWLARFPRRRLEAESIRDSMLAVSGTLNHQAGGPGVRPPLPGELIQSLKSGQWETSPRQADHYRRSIYIFARRNLRYPLLATFDRPAADTSCAARHPSTTSIQSLLLLNSEFTLDAAERLARLVAARQTDLAGQYQDVYRRVLTRLPTDDELGEGVTFLRSQSGFLRREGHPDPESAALRDLCRVVFNTNAFLYVD